jgi:hypothetical protein
MKPILLKDGFYLTLERYEKRVRLIVTSNKTELVCRKESFQNLEQFLQSGQQHIFKGRLQLYKDSEDVQVEVKGEILGKVPADQLGRWLTALKENR